MTQRSSNQIHPQGRIPFQKIPDLIAISGERELLAMLEALSIIHLLFLILLYCSHQSYGFHSLVHTLLSGPQRTGLILPPLGQKPDTENYQSIIPFSSFLLLFMYPVVLSHVSPRSSEEKVVAAQLQERNTRLGLGPKDGSPCPIPRTPLSPGDCSSVHPPLVASSSHRFWALPWLSP